MDKIKIGVIGVGHWGPNVIRNIENNKDSELLQICDINRDRFQKIKNIVSKDCKFTTNEDEIFENRELNTIAIITPAVTHYDLVKKALLAGKHVLCEKPLTLEWQKAQKLYEIAENVNRKLMVNHTFLYNKGIKKIEELIENRSLGELYYLTSKRTHLGLVRNDVDAVWDLAPHDISIMNYLLKSVPFKVTGVGGNPLKSKNEDFAFINLFYPNNVIAQIHISWVDSNKERSLSVVGSNARAVFDDLNNFEPVRIYKKGISIKKKNGTSDFGEFRYLLRDGDIISPKIDIKEPLSEMYQNFVDIILNNNENIFDANFTINVTKVINAIKESINDFGAPKEV